MRAIPADAGPRSLVLVCAVLAAMWALDAGAAQPEKPGKKDDPPKAQPARTTDTPPAKKEAPKTYAFEMRAKPWPQVMEWLAEITGMPVVNSTGLPTGTFNFIGTGK